MLPERVDEMLKNYKAYAGRCKHLEMEILMMQGKASDLWITRAEDMAYHAQNYEAMDMPRGTGVGAPTEALALRLANGDIPDHVREMFEEIVALKKEYQQKMITVKFVEAWLSGLPEKDRWLIEQQVIEGRYWREITLEWGRKFGEALSKDHIRKLKARALEKVYEMAG